MTVDDTEVLRAIARSEDIEPGTLWIADGVVWHTDAAGSTRTVCVKGTPYWSKQVAAALALRLIDRVSGSSRGRAAD